MCVGPISVDWRSSPRCMPCPDQFHSAVVTLAYASAVPLLGVADVLGTNALSITLRDNVGVADSITQTRLGSDGL